MRGGKKKMIKRPKETERGTRGRRRSRGKGKVEKHKECEKKTRGQGSPQVALRPAEATLQ